MTSHKVKVVFTPGKEIENLFLDEALLMNLLPRNSREELGHFLDELYKEEYDNCFSRYVEFQHQFSDERKGKAYSSTYRDLKPSFDVNWNDRGRRHNLIPGKSSLAKLRVFFRNKYNINLPTSFLVKRLSEIGNGDAMELVSSLYK